MKQLFITATLLLSSLSALAAETKLACTYKSEDFEIFDSRQMTVAESGLSAAVKYDNTKLNQLNIVEVLGANEFAVKVIGTTGYTHRFYDFKALKAYECQIDQSNTEPLPGIGREN